MLVRALSVALAIALAAAGAQTWRVARLHEALATERTARAAAEQGLQACRTQSQEAYQRLQEACRVDIEAARKAGRVIEREARETSDDPPRARRTDARELRDIVGQP